MIAVVKVTEMVDGWPRSWWEPMTFRWQTEAAKHDIPRCAHRCRCGTRLRAMTPESLSLLIAAHRAKCPSS